MSVGSLARRGAIALATVVAMQSAGMAGTELTASAGVRFGGEIRPNALPSDQIDASPAFGLTLDIPLRKPGRYVAVLWSRQNTTGEIRSLVNPDQELDLTIDYLQAAGVYRPDRGKKNEPFVLFGLGIAHFGASGFDGDLAFSGVIGGGTRYKINDLLGFRFDARGYFTMGSVSLSGVCGGVGCSVKYSASGGFQFEGLVGLSFAF